MIYLNGRKITTTKLAERIGHSGAHYALFIRSSSIPVCFTLKDALREHRRWYDANSCTLARKCADELKARVLVTGFCNFILHFYRELHI